MKKIKWSVNSKKLGDLKPFLENPRIHTEKGIRELKRSLKSIGYVSYIIVDFDNTIISGHARYTVLCEENSPDFEVECMTPDRKLTEKEFQKILIELNKAIAGEWDNKKIHEILTLDERIYYEFEEEKHELKEEVHFFVNSKEDKEIQVVTCPKCNHEFEVE